MPTIHLRNKDDSTLPQPEPSANGKWKSGYWYVSEARAEQLKGGEIHLHRETNAPSFLSGIIEEFTREPFTNLKDGTEKTRTAFHFVRVVEIEGTTTGADGWLQSGVKFVP
jgi:hypothetical protein